MTLNLCRVAAFAKSDLILSKKQGGEWALQNLPEEYHPLVLAALESYASGNEMDINEAEAQEFAEDMLGMIRMLS